MAKWFIIKGIDNLTIVTGKEYDRFVHKTDTLKGFEADGFLEAVKVLDEYKIQVEGY